MAARSLLLGLSTIFLSAQADAQLVFGNGSFELGIPDGVHQTDVAAPWFDFDGVNFFDNAWQISIDGISPNDTPVLALSAFAADGTLDGAGLNGYAYQSLGTADGATELTLTFDWGSFDDAPGPRDLGLTFSILEDTTGGFVPNQNVDVLGQAGVTVVDSMSETQLDVPISGMFSEEWSFDLSSAGSGPLYLRINNYEPSVVPDDPNEAWVFVDNIVCDVCEPPGELTLEVDRDTGDAEFLNSLGPVSLVQYSITSAAGVINVDNWDSIASTGDADSGGSLDPDDNWMEQVATPNEITETEPIGGGGPDDGVQLGTSLPLGEGLWVKSPFEDFAASVILFDGVNEITQSIAVNFSGTVQTVPYMRSDFDFDNDIDEDDFNTFFDNHLTTLTATVPGEAYGFGDLDGDLDNDVFDFGLFKTDFVAANGEQAFAALLASRSVPEPSGAVIVIAGLIALGATRMRSRRATQSAAKAICVAALAGAVMLQPAEAAVVSFSTSAPTSDGDDVFHFITSALTDVGNVYDSIVGAPAADGAENDYATYVAFDRQHQGQTFTTGATGGFVNAVWLQHVGYTANTGEGTFYNTAPGSTFQVRITDPSQAGTAGFALADETSIALNGLEGNSIAPGGLTNTPNGTETWVRFAFENPISVTGNTSYGFDVTGLATGFFETLGSNADAYAGGSAYNGTTVAMADNVLNPLLGDRAFFVEIDETPGNPQPEQLVLNVDQDSGLMGITNNTNASFEFDHYEIRSEVGGLDSLNWESLSSRGVDAVDGSDPGTVAGDSAGETWTVPGGVQTGQTSTGLLAEAFVLGSTTVNPSQTLLLGSGYNTSIDDTNLMAALRSTTGAVLSLSVAYDGVPVQLGEFNGDGVVDAADYAKWRDNLGKDEAVLSSGSGDGSGTVDDGDYDFWVSNYGVGLAAGALGIGEAAAVPEPSSALLLAAIVNGGSLVRRRRS